MLNSRFRRYIAVPVVLCSILCSLVLSSCYGSQSAPLSLDAGAGNLALTGSQITQYNLIRFNTAAAERTLTLPSAADIVSTLGVSAGSFTALVVTADGGRDVKIIGGTNVTVKPSAATTPGNTTKTIFLVLENVGSGSQSVIVY